MREAIQKYIQQFNIHPDDVRLGWIYANAMSTNPEASMPKWIEQFFNSLNINPQTLDNSNRFLLERGLNDAVINLQRPSPPPVRVVSPATRSPR